MPGLEFERPVGADADVKELEYVIALHQTSEKTRPNATVSSQDIVALLKSRYDLTISHQDAIQVVRALGGGDNIVDERQEAKSFVNDLLASLKSRLSKENSSSSSSVQEHGDNLELAHEQPPVTNNAQPEETTSSTRGTSFLARKMQALHGMHSQMQMDQMVGLPPKQEQSMRNLQKSITNNLRARVIQKAQKESQKRLLGQPLGEEETANDEEFNEPPAPKERVRTKEQNQTAHEDVEVIDVDDDANLLNFAAGEVVVANSVSGGTMDQEEEEEVTFSQNGANEEDPPAEFLDLVQVLSTILIPTFSRIPVDLKKEETTMEANVTGDEVTKDDADREKEETEPRLLAKLKNRFVKYGRRKLNLKDDSSECQFKARDFMDVGKRAMLKSLVGDDEDDELGGSDPVMDESLMQLLLISHGEIERANNPHLIKEMVAMAHSKSGLFDDEALLNAISSDLGPWDPSCMDVPTSFFYDVFQQPSPSVQTILEKVDETGSTELVAEDEPTKTPTADAESPSPVKEDRDTADEERRTKDLGFCSKCLKVFFPVIYANRHDHHDFSTLFAGIDMAVDLKSSLLVSVMMWFTYFAMYVLTFRIFVEFVVFLTLLFRLSVVSLSLFRQHPHVVCCFWINLFHNLPPHVHLHPFVLFQWLLGFELNCLGVS